MRIPGDVNLVTIAADCDILTPPKARELARNAKRRGRFASPFNSGFSRQLRRNPGSCDRPGLNPGESAAELVQPEIHFHADLYGHRLAILHGRLELPFADRFNRLLIQPHAKSASHTDLARRAVRVHNHP